MGETPHNSAEIPVGSSVRVQRSSGEIEEGWELAAYFDWPEGWEGFPAGTPAAIVTKPATETDEELSKDVSVEQLLSWQLEVEGETSPNV